MEPYAVDERNLAVKYTRRKVFAFVLILVGWARKNIWRGKNQFMQVFRGTGLEYRIGIFYCFISLLLSYFAGARILQDRNCLTSLVL